MKKKSHEVLQCTRLTEHVPYVNYKHADKVENTCTILLLKVIKMGINYAPYQRDQEEQEATI